MEAERRQRNALIDWGVAARTLEGEKVSGDLCLIQPLTDGVLTAVVDGVGHGDEATFAAKKAIATLAESAAESAISMVKRCHDALAKTRGAVITIAIFHATEGTMTWLGVGNVEGLLLRKDVNAVPSSERALLRGGLVGYQLPPLYASVVPVHKGDLLILATDGMRSSFLDTIGQSLESPQTIADRIMGRSYKGADDALVLVARYLGRHE